ncbi:Alpha/Beta hydrolase protein [Mucor lusitanicus]|uniref:Alpha/Beta hydrolase protein n=1 Tax=Mucor circinelloides f. lusitanicus TaxID=29924 RepID=A0A8H4B7E1_MUCCL|nr:Alpha/Beta hydrolase protein [Mucor lusitanicus]
MFKLIIKISSLLVAFYIAIIGILSIDTPQRCLMFLHWVKFPFHPRFDVLEYYGFAHNQGRNIKITTSDNVTIGAWHFLPTEYYKQQQQLRLAQDSARDDEMVFDAALADPQYETIVYFHGNALHRAAPWRVDLYKQLLLRFGNVNLIAIDYRGFGDSESTPSEFGLRIDAQSTLDWLNEKGAPNHRISLIGHSLGTGVATTLAHDMSASGSPPKSLILKAGYSSMTTLIFEYNVIPKLPILSPIKRIPALEKWLLSKLNHKFNSLSRIQDVNCPILIIYGKHDVEIPISNSQALFRHALNSTESVDALVAAKRVVHTAIPNEANVYYAAAIDRSSKPRFMLVELIHANHNNVGYFDYTYESIAAILR